jgi:methylglutaconyl-CoA hydratase
MNPDLVLIHRDGPAAILTLNRPEKRNALSRALVAALGGRLAEAASDVAVRVVLLAARGPVFCAGLDLDELTELMQQPDARECMQQASRQLAAVYRAMASSAKPTIAVVNGPAVAGGAGLVTACDLAVATPTAKFGYPEVRRGIVPAIITPMLTRVVPMRVASELLLGGNLIEAAEAQRLGLYNRIVPAEQLHDEAMGLARDIAGGGPQTIAAAKKWIDRCFVNPDLWVESADASAAGRFSAECEEGLRAFREKRDPVWDRPGE